MFHYTNLTASGTHWTEASVAVQNSGSITASMFVNAQGKSQPNLVPRSFLFEKELRRIEKERERRESTFSGEEKKGPWEGLGKEEGWKEG